MKFHLAAATHLIFALNCYNWGVGGQGIKQILFF